MSCGARHGGFSLRGGTPARGKAQAEPERCGPVFADSAKEGLNKSGVAQSIQRSRNASAPWNRRPSRSWSTIRGSAGRGARRFSRRWTVRSRGAGGADRAVPSAGRARSPTVSWGALLGAHRVRMLRSLDDPAWRACSARRSRRGASSVCGCRARCPTRRRSRASALCWRSAARARRRSRRSRRVWPVSGAGPRRDDRGHEHHCRAVRPSRLKRPGQPPRRTPKPGLFRLSLAGTANPLPVNCRIASVPPRSRKIRMLIGLRAMLFGIYRLAIRPARCGPHLLFGLTHDLLHGQYADRAAASCLGRGAAGRLPSIPARSMHVKSCVAAHAAAAVLLLNNSRARNGFMQLNRKRSDATHVDHRITSAF